MVKRKDMLKALSAVLVTLYTKYSLLMPGMDGEMPVAELFLQNVFSGNQSREHTKIVIAMFGLLEIVIFNLLFGAHVYRDLYENSAYIFVREKSRRKWFAGKTGEVLLYSALYNILFIGITFGLCAVRSGQRIDFMAVKVAVLTYVLITLFAFWTTLLINLTAMGTGVTVSFIINYILLTFMSLFAIEFEKIPVINRFRVLLSLNPVVNVTINWSTDIGSGRWPVLYFVVLCVLTYAVGCVFLQRLDISVKNRD